MGRIGKSKCINCTYKSTFNGQNGTLYDFNVSFEDGTQGVYSAKDMNNPKFKVGEVVSYEVEEKPTRNGNTFNKIKHVSERDQQGGGAQGSSGGGYKSRPKWSIALEWGRKMYNSSHKTDKPWTTASMYAAAEFLLKQLESGVDRDALDTAVIIECANGMGGIQMTSQNLKKNIQDAEAWIKKHQ